MKKTVFNLGDRLRALFSLTAAPHGRVPTWGGLGLLRAWMGALVLALVAVPAVALTITNVAGNGSFAVCNNSGLATASPLRSPYGVAVDSAGNRYIADSAAHVVCKVDASGIISIVAGTGASGDGGDGGAANAAGLNSPGGVAVDGTGNLYIADTGNDRIRKVTASSGVISGSSIISTVAGTLSRPVGPTGYNGDNQPAGNAWLNNPSGVAFDGAGNLYIADRTNNRIRKVTVCGGTISGACPITTVAGYGDGTTLGTFDRDGQTTANVNSIDQPMGVAFDSAGNFYIADMGNHRIRKVNASTGIIIDPASMNLTQAA